MYRPIVRGHSAVCKVFEIWLGWACVESWWISYKDGKVNQIDQSRPRGSPK